MVQVHHSCCACTVCADLCGIQLAVVFQLFSSCSASHSLCCPSSFVSHLSGCNNHCSGASNGFHLDLLTQMASWPFILTWSICFNVSTAPVASTAYPIMFGAFDNVLVDPIILDMSSSMLRGSFLLLCGFVRWWMWFWRFLRYIFDGYFIVLIVLISPCR